MKKTLIVALLALALVFAFAATAVARPNGDMYIDWDATGENAAVPSPHAGYTASTEKCNVCHAVHYAAPDNYTWSGTTDWKSTANTQMLLRSTVGNSCNYCHIDTAIGGVRIYNANPSISASPAEFSHNYASCTACHSVHGANAFKGANESKILRIWTPTAAEPYRTIQPEVIGTGGNAAITPLFAGAAAAIASTDKYAQQVAFCSQCHYEYTTDSALTIDSSAGYWVSGAYDGVDYKGHPMKSAETTFSAPGATTDVQVAWVGSNTCRSCHDAGDVNIDPLVTPVSDNSFPHFTNGYYRFQTSGAFVGDELAADPALANATDGLCLKCHVNSAQDAGINITY